MKDKSTQLIKVNYDPFREGVIESIIPTSAAQKEIWTSINFESDATLCYNETIELELSGIVNIGILEHAFKEVVNRYPILNATFSSDGKNLLITNKQNKLLELRDLSKSFNAIEEYNLFKKEIQKKPHRIESDLLFYGVLFKFSDTSYQLVIYTHHIVCDGWSYAIILNELSEIYAKLVNGEMPILNEVQSFEEYVNVIEPGLPRDNCKKYWLDIFKGYKKDSAFPTDFERSQYRTFNSERVDFKLDQEKVFQFKKLCSKNGVSLYTGLISVYLVLLNKISRQKSFVVGLSSATQPALDNNLLVGHFVNLLPFMANLTENMSFIDLLKSNKTPMLDAFENQFITFGELVSELKIPRVIGEMPLISHVFNIDQQNEDQGLNFKNLKAKYKSIPRTYENFEIFINAVSRGNYLELECQYNKNLYERSTIENWMKQFSDVVDLVLLNNNIPLNDIFLQKLKIPTASKLISKVELKRTSASAKEIELVKKYWSEILFLDNLSDSDNFFQLGGHSLLAIELINKLQVDLNLKVSMKDIFENPSVIEFATFISLQSSLECQTHDKSHQDKVTLKKSGLKEYKLSNSQMQIWYLEEITPNTQMHNLPSAIKINFLVDHSRLIKVFEVLLERHESFRTVIVKNKGRPIQKVVDLDQAKAELSIEFESVGEDENIERRLHQDADVVFHKDNFPLFKVKLYHLGKNQSVLFFMVHHAIWDGWCFDIFFDELNQIYSNLDVKLPEIENSYLDHTAWLDESIQNGSFENSLQYWNKKLSGDLPIINLPIDYKRPKELNHIGKSVYFEIDSKNVDALKVIASKYNTSLFNLFLTAFKITLLDFARENSDFESIVVGMPVRARTHASVMNTIGFFVNTMAIKSEIDFENTFSHNLKSVSQNVIEAYDHQMLPFQIILNNLTSIDKENGRLPVFQTFFSYQDVSNRDAKFNGHSYSQINVDKQSVHTELDLWIKSSPLKTEGAFEFEVDLFDQATIENIKDHFTNLLKAIIGHGLELKLNDYSVNQMQKARLLFDYNNTKKDFDQRPFIYLIDEMAEKYPDKVALIDESKKLTYAELKERSNSLAGHIKESVNSSDLVGIALNRSVDMLVGILGILKANKGYVPLDPNFPSDRIEYMLSHSKIDSIVTESSLIQRFQNVKNRIVIDQFDFKSDQNLKYNVSANQTAYVIYTSGSTGLPKGVELPHLSVSNFLQGMNEYKIAEKDDRLLAVTTLSFDIAVLELYLPLINGGSVYIANSKDVIDGQKLNEIIVKHNITSMQATPTTWRLLLQAGFKGKDNLTILCGGESFPHDLASKLIPMVKRVLNMYGPTETTVWSSIKTLSLSDSFITIGRPILNTTFYLFDEHMRLVPEGAIGQLYIGGTGLAKGYLNRPDLTKERFISNPLVAGELIYATGDLARYNSQHELICLGRNDGQVKVRGFRIELGEIEAAISKFPSIHECATIVHDFGNGDKRIIGYYSLSSSAQFHESDLKSHIVKALPSYMVPSILIKLESIPKTPNGKIDKKSLPKEKFKTDLVKKEAISSNYESIEKTLNIDDPILKIFSELLRNSKIKLTDNFFDLGGNSLIAVELMARLSEIYDREIQLSVLLESKDIQDFKNRIEEKNSSQLVDIKNDRTLLVPHIEQVFKSLVTIKNSGHKNPIFCFHGVGGNVLNYISLLPALNQERPLYAFQSIGLDGESEPLLSIEEMALHYYRELKILKPEGPYILAGGSMGGLIALEVARRLKAAGDEIEMLLMFDTFGPNFNLKKYQAKRKVNIFRRIMNSLKYRCKILFNLQSVRFRRNLGVKIPIKSLLVEIEYKNYSAIWKYNPKSYQGDIVLIRSNLEESGWYSDPLLGWEGVIAGKVEKHFMEGAHESFIENPELIKILKKVLK